MPSSRRPHTIFAPELPRPCPVSETMKPRLLRWTVIVASFCIAYFATNPRTMRCELRRYKDASGHRAVTGSAQSKNGKILGGLFNPDNFRMRLVIRLGMDLHEIATFC